MKKIFTLLFLTTAVLSVMAQGGHTLMKFSGKATIEVMGNIVSTLESDTVLYSGSDITLPKMVYGNLVIPSFTIHNVQFSMDMATMTVTFPEQQFTETITVDGEQKTITGTSLSGSFVHDANNTFTLKTTFQYGKMPMPLTYEIVAYYIKDSTGSGEGEVSAVEAVKTIEKNDAPSYNLAGQRTTTGYKGVVIKGGKKYFQR